MADLKNVDRVFDSSGNALFSGGGGNLSALFHIQDQKSAGTNGGASAAATWQIRDINAVVSNQIVGASISSNQFILPPGNYLIFANAPGFDVDMHRIRLENKTAMETTMLGISSYSEQGSITAQTNASLSGNFSIATQSTFEIEHYTALTKASTGLGVGTNAGVTEIFTDIKIWKLDGTNNAIGSSVTLTGLWEELDRQEAADSSEIDFTFTPADFDEFEIIINGYVPATGAADLWMRVSIDGGSTFEASANDYDTNIVFISTVGDSSSVAGTADATFMDMTGDMSNSEKGQVNVTFGDMSLTGRKSFFSNASGSNEAGPDHFGRRGTHQYIGSDSPVNGIRFIPDTGNITFGTFILRGRRKGGISLPVLGGPTAIRGAVLVKTTAETLVANVSEIINWDTTPTIDTDEFFNSSNPSRLTIPNGITKVKISTNGRFAGLSNTNQVSMIILKNGSNDYPGSARTRFETGGASTVLHQGTQTAILNVVAGDYFEIEVLSGGNQFADATTNNYSWFAIEVLEGPLAPTTHPVRSALVRITTDQEIADATWVAIAWDEAVNDSSNMWSGGNPTRLTVPVGVTKVRMVGNAAFDSSATGINRSIRITKNGSIFTPLAQTLQDAAEATSHVLNLTSPILIVNAGDYFELEALHNGGASFGVISVNDLTWFSMEIVEPAAISQDVVESVTLTGLWEELDRQEASASANIDFTFNPNEFDELEIVVSNMLPTNDAAVLWLRVSIDGGSTFEAAGTDYDTNMIIGNADVDSVQDAGTQGIAQMILSTTLDNATDRFSHNTINMGDLSGTGDKVFHSFSGGPNSAGNWRTNIGTHKYKGSTSIVNGLRLLVSAATIATGTFILRGRRKAGITIPVLGGPSGVRGATLQLDSDFTVTDDVATVINWDSTSLDTDGFFSIVNPSRITIPAGVSRIRLTAGFALSLLASGVRAIGFMTKNGAQDNGEALGRLHIVAETASDGVGGTMSSGILKVIPGDYFEFTVNQNSATDETLPGGATADAEHNFFSIEVLEGPLSPVERGARGALVKPATDQIGVNFVGGVAVTFDNKIYDTSQIHSVTNPTRLTVPPGVNKVRLTFGTQLANTIASEFAILSIRKNGTFDWDGLATQRTEVTTTNVQMNCSTPVVEVVAGDYFEAFIQIEAETTVDVDASRTTFAMEIIEPVGIAPETQFDGALMQLTAGNQSITQDTDTPINWTSPVFDTKGFWSSGAPSRLTIPAGISEIRLAGNLNWASDVDLKQLIMWKNGALFAGAARLFGESNIASAWSMNGTGAVIQVVEGDYFELIARIGGAGAVDINASIDTWFSLEVVKGAVKPTPVEVRGARLKLTSDQTGLTGTAILSWDVAARDTDGFFSTSNPTRITVPTNSGITKARINFGSFATGAAANERHFCDLFKNGIQLDDGGFFLDDGHAGTSRSLSGSSAILDVSEGDYFEIDYSVTSGTDVLEIEQTYFEIEVIEPAVLAIESATFRGALINLAADITGVNYTSETAIPFETIIYDTDQIWSSTNATRLTVPSGVTHVRLNFSPFLNNIVEGQWTRLDIFKNGTSAYDGTTTLRQDNSGIGQGFSLISPILEVIAGDYFEAFVLIETETTIDVESTRTTFGMEIIEPLVKTNKIRGPWLELDRQSASASANLDFTFDPTLYDQLEVVITDLAPSETTFLAMRTSTDGGSTFDEGASDYSSLIKQIGMEGTEFTVVTGNDGATLLRLTPATGSGTNQFWALTVTIADPNSSQLKMVYQQGAGRADDGNEYTSWGGGSRLDTAAINGIQFLLSAGTMTTGTFILYGRPTAGVDANLLPGFTGKQTLWIPAAAMTPTVSDGCATLAAVETVAGQPDQHVLAFATGADEHAQFDIAFPNSWDKGTLTFKVFWTHQGGQGGGLDGVAWGLQAISLSSGDPFATAYGTPIVVTDDQITLDDIYVTAESAVMTVGGTPVNDDLTFFRIFRDISDGADDLDIDAQLVGVQVFYTSNKLTDD